MPESELALARDGIGILANTCLKIGFTTSAKYAFSVCNDILNNHQMTYGEYGDRLSILMGRIQDESEMELFLWVPKRHAKLFESKYPPFGAQVFENFPSVTYDIAEAATCLSLERSTACIFHLMRVMEAGLKSLSRALDIPYAPSWESYLKQINDRVSEKYKKKGISWKKDEAFFVELAGDLLTVKIAWRNPTMHIVRVYTQEEAETIFRAVESFVQKLASRFSERRPRNAKKK